MFTDLRGFTAETSKRSRDQISKLLEAHEKVTRNVVSGLHGRIIKNLGDGFLIVFESPTNALLAAKELQSQVKTENAKLENKDRFQVKIAIASGDVIAKDDDVFGEPVNTAARVLAGVEPGEIYLTQSVYLAMNRNELLVKEIGERSYKGIPHKVRIYKVEGKKTLLTSLTAPFKKAFEGKKMAKNMRYAIAVVAFLLVASGVYAALQQRNNIQDTGPEVVGAQDSFEDNGSGSDEAAANGQNTGGPQGNNGQGGQNSKVQGVQATPPGQNRTPNPNGGGTNNTPKPTPTPKLNTPKPAKTPTPPPTPTPPASLCKGGAPDGKCNNGQEDFNSCPEDCSAPTPSPAASETCVMQGNHLVCRPI